MRKCVPDVWMVGLLVSASACVVYPSAPNEEADSMTVAEQGTATDSETQTNVSAGTDMGTIHYACPPTMPDDHPDDDTYPSCASTAVDHVSCVYNDFVCVCGVSIEKTNMVWQCNPCPSKPPAVGDTCYASAMQCQYDGYNCECSQGTTSLFWNCYQCPEALPDMDMSDDERSDCDADYPISCRYGDDTLCACNYSFTEPKMEWQCTTCPASRPLDGTFCTTLNSRCEYEGASCVCGMISLYLVWKCDSL